MDIYICEPDSAATQELKDLCVRCFIQMDIDSEIWTAKNVDELIKSLAENPLINIFMIGIEQELYEFSGYVKQCNQSNYIILLGNDIQKLFSCVSPQLRPSGIILRPVNNEELSQILKEIWSDFQSFSEDENNFSFQIKATHYAVPCKQIVYFESASKKIVLRTANQEFEFYGSMEKIIRTLPKTFFRVHRSFIINGEKIRAVNFAESTITFENESFVYFSRSYKSTVQKYLGGNP